ncbi:unnamed protein product [Prunus armeniaca]
MQSLKNCRATSANLHKKKIARSPMCPLCNDQSDTAEHILLLYPWMEHVWFRCSLNIRINQQAVTSFGQWLRNVIEEGKTLQERSQCLIVIAYFCWQIWKDRCKAVLEYISLSPTRTIHAASTAINEFLGTLDHGRHQTEPPTLSNGTPMEIFSMVHPSHLWLRCWLVSKVISSLLRWVVIMSHLNMITCVWTWIPRTANQVAYHLAMLANSRMSPGIWVNRPLSSLMHILNKDGLPCPPRNA